MNDEYELPEVRPDLKPLSPRIKMAVMGRVREHEKTRSKALTGIAVVFLIALVYLFVRSHTAVPSPSKQLAAPPMARPTPVPPPAPVVPQLPPESDSSTTEYVKDPIRPAPAPNPKEYREVLPDGTTSMRPWPKE